MNRPATDDDLAFWSCLVIANIWAATSNWLAGIPWALVAIFILISAIRARTKEPRND